MKTTGVQPELAFSRLDLDQLNKTAARLLRKGILTQYVGPDHGVLTDEKRLVGASKDAVRELVRDLVSGGYGTRAVRAAVYRRIRDDVRALAELHDVEDAASMRAAVAAAEGEAASMVTEVDVSDLEEADRAAPLQQGLTRAS